jgi:hypothetical protein
MTLLLLFSEKEASNSGQALFAGAWSFSANATVLRPASALSSGVGSMVPFALRQHVMLPDGDLSDGTWTTDTGGNDLWTAIDETAANDADFIRSANNPSSNACEVSMTNPSFNRVAEGVVEYRYCKAGTGQIDITVSLKQGAATIATWTHTDVGTTETTASQTLTTPQLEAITDFNALSLQFTANAP